MVGKIARHERSSGRYLDSGPRSEPGTGFAHAVSREDRAREGAAREIYSRTEILEGRAFAHPTAALPPAPSRAYA
ncbi:MAG: hypothetical protein QOD29_3681 [Alphaproteobacteria bacterium]|nr:hypothetical protein [Alphaproteobacteria bacterium]